MAAASRVIFKYPVPITDTFELELPYGANICLFAVKKNDKGQGWPQLWIEHSATGGDRRVMRRFRLFGTGRTIEGDELVHVGSVITGPRVWHLFEDLSACKEIGSWGCAG